MPTIFNADFCYCRLFLYRLCFDRLLLYRFLILSFFIDRKFSVSHFFPTLFWHFRACLVLDKKFSGKGEKNYSISVKIFRLLGDSYVEKSLGIGVFRYYTVNVTKQNFRENFGLAKKTSAVKKSRQKVTDQFFADFFLYRLFLPIR